jgi:hypothetical protein
MGALSEWLQVMLGEIRRKREQSERECEEQSLRSTECGQGAAPLNQPAGSRADCSDGAGGESDDDQRRVC